MLRLYAVICVCFSLLEQNKHFNCLYTVSATQSLLVSTGVKRLVCLLRSGQTDVKAPYPPCPRTRPRSLPPHPHRKSHHPRWRSRHLQWRTTPSRMSRLMPQCMERCRRTMTSSWWTWGPGAQPQTSSAPSRPSWSRTTRQWRPPSRTSTPSTHAASHRRWCTSCSKSNSLHSFSLSSCSCCCTISQEMMYQLLKK